MTKHLTILIAILLAALGLRVQTKVYPIQVTISGRSDISPELSELYGIKSTLMFTFQCLDRKETNLPVAVKVRLYPALGRGKAIENTLQTGRKTFDIGFGQTIIEQKGELEKYFLNEYTNLSQAGYYQNGQLAEGNYILQVTCYDARTISRQISNTAKMYLHIDQFGYPTLLQPRSGTDLEQYTTKPAISFQWTYYGKTDPKIRYRFELWEVINATTVETYVKQTKPIFTEEDLFVTQKSYMPELLNLKIGQKYCWRVTAYDPDGKLPFKHGGESDVYQFQYLNPPVPVTGLANKVTGKQIKYTWNADRNHTKYYVEYYDYKRDTTISSSQQDNTVTLTAPEYDYRIKFRVRAECYNDPARVSDYTPWSEAYVQPEKKIDFECGKQFPDREIANQELKTTFFEGEIVESKNGDSRYEIIKATARPDGSLDGKFYAIMDCWSGAKILCDFWDTKINTDNIILTTRYRSEDIPGFVADPEEIKKYAHELVNNAHMAATDNKIRDTILINQKFDYLYAENGRLKAVVIDKNGEPQVTDVTPDKPYSQSLITDGQGDTLVVSKKGQVMGVKEYKFAGDDRHLLNEYHRQLDSLGDWQINFNSAKAKQTYAFDQIGSGNHGIFATDEYYPKSGNYDFRYKSVECGKNDKVIVDFGAYPEKDSVIFKDKYGVKLKVVDGNILSFTGVSKADTNFIYAYRGDKKIGKLFLNTYQRKIYNVVLVSVNEAKILHEKNVEKAVKKVEESLNIVYNQCAVKFEISTDKITINDLPSFSHGGSGILTVYNDDQKKVLSAYEKEKKMTDGVYYLFFIDNVTDKKDGSGTPVSGYMPRGYNAGFIYDGGSPHTIAHELGHGIAGLEHVFENSNASGKTANLMDYASGEELWHFQWDQIQDPSRVWMKWNKAEEEGENQIEPEPELRNLYKYPIPDSPVSGIFIAPSEWPIWINDVKNVYVLAPSYYGISLNDSQRPDAAIYGFATSVDPENFYMAKFSEKGHFEGFYKGDVLYVDKDNETLNHYHQTGSPVYYWDISSRTLLNNLYVAPKTPVGDEWSPNSYSAVMPDIIEIERQNRLEELLKKKNDGQWQFWFYDVKNNKIVVVYDYTGGRLLRTQNRQTIALKDIQDADIESMSQKEYANSDYNWLANDVRSTMNEAGTYVAEGMAVILAAPYLLDAALVGEGVSGKFAQGFLSDFVSNSVANMVTYFIVEHWINDNPKKTWNEYFDFKEMVLDASIAGAKNLYAPASLKGKLLYDAAVDGIQAVNVRELLDNETTFLDQVVNFGIGAGVAVIVDAITPRLTRKLAKHSFTKTLDFVQLRKAVTSTTFAKNEKFVSVINQLLAGVAVPKVFKFSTNIDEKQFRKIVGDLLNTDQGAMSLNIIRRSSKEFTSVEEFEKLAGNLVSSLDNVNISNCNDIVNNISSKIIDGIADLCLSNHHYANTVVFLNKLFTSKLSNKADILNVCFTHQHSALLVGDLGRLIDKYDIGDLISNISSFKSYRTLSEQLSGKYGSRESARLMFDFLFSHHFEANKIDDYMSGVEVKEIDGIITMLESTGGLDLMDLLKGASAEVDDELLFACTNLYTYFRKGINSTDFDYVQKIFKINYNKNKEWWKQPFAEIADVYKRYRFSKDGVTPHLELLAMDIDGMTSEFSKVFKFSTNIDKRHLKSVVDNLLKNTEKGRQSLLLLSRGTKQFNNISEFETVVNKVNQCFSEIKSDDCNSIIRDLSSHNNSPEIIKGIANLCLSDHSATNVKFLTKLFNSNIKNKADIVDYCIKHKHTDLLVDDLDWIFNSTKIDDFISQISSFESFSDLSANLLGRGREQAAKLIFDFLLSHHFEANIINKYMSGENVQEIIDIRQMLSSSGGLDLMDLLKKASVSVDRDLLSACKNLYGKFKGGMQQMDIDYAIRVFENNKNPKQTIVDLTEVYNSFSSSDATRYLELLANDRKASLSLLTDDVDISLASVAMSDTGPFRASLPVKYQEYNITHLLIKTEDNKPAYVKVIDGVKRYAVVLIQKNEKDWVVFGLVLSSVGGDVAKNGDFQEAIKEEIKYIINEIKKRSDK